MKDYNFTTNQFNHSLKQSEISLRQWYLPLVFSVICLSAGIYLVINPDALFITFSYMVATLFLLFAINRFRFNIINNKTSVSGLKHHYQLLKGLIFLVISFLFYLYPEISIITIPFFLGFLAVLFSIILFFIGRNTGPISRFRFSNPYKWFIAGSIFLLIAFIAFTQPTGFSKIVGFWIGVLFLLLSVGGIVLSLLLRKLKIRLPFNFSKL